MAVAGRTRENDGGTRETDGDDNARCAADETGDAGYVRHVAGSGSLQAKLKKLLRICPRGLRERHGDADRQPVLGGVDETDGKLNSANAERSSGRSETRLRSGETDTGEESCRSGGQDACS